MTAPDDRYRWHVPVADAFDRPAVVWIGTDDGKVITSTPLDWHSATPREAYLLSAAYVLAFEMAQEELRKVQQDQQEDQT